MDRRDFLRTASIAAGAAVLPLGCRSVGTHKGGGLIPDAGPWSKEMSERGIILSCLDYRMPLAVGTFKAIPEDKVAERPAKGVDAPGWVFGHIAVTERVHVGMYIQGVDDVPARYKLFYVQARGCDQGVTEAELRNAIESKDALISYWEEVRRKTTEYLNSITDADLRVVPGKSLLPPNDPNRENPVREWFIMTICHQYSNWGRLEVIEKLISARS